MKKNFSILTLGCRVNQYESEAIAERLEENGFVRVEKDADIVIINTCTVTAESDRKSRQMIRRGAKQNPGAAVIVTGCYAETGLRELRKMDCIDYIVGVGAKDKIPSVAQKAGKNKTAVEIIPDVSAAEYDSLCRKTDTRFRSYVKIEDGCNGKCSYCIISSARGRVRSRNEEDILKEVKSLLSGGVKEIILTGIETAAYGSDFGKEKYRGESLASLIRKIDSLGCERITLGSLDPALISEEFVKDIKDIKGLMPHFHLSVQSASSATLAAMKRKYNAEMLKRSVELLKENIDGCTFSADVIVGFPGETVRPFFETLSFFEVYPFLHLHIFPYSVRKNTEAEKMPGQKSDEEKAKRARELADAQKRVKSALLDGYVQSHRERPVFVLVEQIKKGLAYGHSEHYAEVVFEAKKDDTGRIIPVTLISHNGDICRGIRSKE